MHRSRPVLLALGLFVLLAAGVAPRLRLLLAARPFAHARPLGVPVVGLRASDVHSTWHARRPGGRRHEGIDLFAARGTPVVSATRGVVWRVGDDALGGRVVTVLGDGPALYYYAHLDDWAPGLQVGQRVERGAALGTVGNTGNARTTPPHLHFGVYRVGWLRSRAVDPAPLLRR